MLNISACRKRFYIIFRIILLVIQCHVRQQHCVISVCLQHPSLYRLIPEVVVCGIIFPIIIIVSSACGMCCVAFSASSYTSCRLLLCRYWRPSLWRPEAIRRHCRLPLPPSGDSCQTTGSHTSLFRFCFFCLYGILYLPDIFSYF